MISSFHAVVQSVGDRCGEGCVCVCVGVSYMGFQGNRREDCSFCVHGDTMASVGLMKYCLRQEERSTSG